MARKLASALMVALMGTPPAVTALGLGELDSDSALNEPLSARIPLLSIRDADAASVRVSLAPPAAFERAGLDRPFYLSRLKFEVKQADGEHYILISTEKPVKEPFLDFLLQVRWPHGDLQREYTVLLDPPQYAAGKPSGPVYSDRATRQSQTGAFPQSPSSTAAAVAGERASGLTRYGPVQANQTLWGIASEVRPHDGITIYQTMQAILRANPEAFIDGNINAIMKGSVLHVPPREEIARIDANAAALQMQEQLALWQRQHSIDASETPSALASTQTTVMGPGEAGEAETVPASSNSPMQGRLHVVAARDGAQSQKASLADQALAPTQQNIVRLQQQLALVEEHNLSLQSANTRLEEQASSLKKELIDLKSIVNFQLDEGVPLPATEAMADRASGSSTAQHETAADLRSEAALANSAEVSPSSHPETTASKHLEQRDLTNKAATAEASQSAPITAVNSAPEWVAATGTSGSSRSPSAADSPKTEAHTTPAEPPPVHVSAHEAPSSAVAGDHPATQQQANPSLKTRLLSYLPHGAKWVVLLASSLLLALFLLWAVRRRRGATAARAHQLSPEALAPTGEQALATIKADEGAPNLARADAQSQLGVAVHESTPLDEAEAHIARGDYEQAQELLDRALGEHPDSQELRLKLLEVLAAQGDRSGFEAEAQVLHTQLADESDPHWQQAIQLARQIAPNHPLFSNAMALGTGTAAVESPNGMNTAAAAESTYISMPQAMKAELELSPVTLALDQSGNPGEETLQPADGRQESAILEFDLGEIEAFALQQAKENAASVSSWGSGDDKDDNDLGSLDFSLPEDWAALSEHVKDNASDSDPDALQLSDVSMQDGLDTEGTSAAETDDSMDLDEVGTKLDLARAYLDMGDAAGARGLLEEVVTEGNAAQQGEAQDLLRQVG